MVFVWGGDYGAVCYNEVMRILEKPLTKKELIDSSKCFIDENAIKGAVDVERRLVAVDSPMHYDCEQLLLENGSKQENIWGINLYLDEDDIDDVVEFNSMINLRPTQGNRSRGVENPEMQKRIKEIVTEWIS